MLRLPVALHHPRFRLLWLGLMISVAGSQMQWATLLLHIYKITGQPVSLGGLGLVRILPVIIFSLLGGAVADVANRRPRLADHPVGVGAAGRGAGPAHHQRQDHHMAYLCPHRRPGGGSLL